MAAWVRLEPSFKAIALSSLGFCSNGAVHIFTFAPEGMRLIIPHAWCPRCVSNNKPTNRFEHCLCSGPVHGLGGARGCSAGGRRNSAGLRAEPVRRPRLPHGLQARAQFLHFQACTMHCCRPHHLQHVWMITCLCALTDTIIVLQMNFLKDLPGHLRLKQLSRTNGSSDDGFAHSWSCAALLCTNTVGPVMGSRTGEAQIHREGASAVSFWGSRLSKSLVAGPSLLLSKFAKACRDRQQVVLRTPVWSAGTTKSRFQSSCSALASQTLASETFMVCRYSAHLLACACESGSAMGTFLPAACR